jgi:cell division protein FtsB
MTLIRRPGMWLVTVSLMLVGLAFITNLVPFRQILEQQDRVEQAQIQLARLAADNVALESQVAALNTPLEIERLAREKMGFVWSGEIGYVVLEPATDQRLANQSQLQVEPIARPWYQRIWDFLTGADLSEG